MLECFMDKQPLFCEEILSSIKNNKVSHAYLIETNDYIERDELILAFVKTLFKSYIENQELFKNVDALINNDSYSNFCIISPDGAWIKKEQILEVKEKFKLTSFDNTPRIYWIKNADKLNKYAANSLLKFLEEPEGNVIAILEVSNRYRILETLRSRCQTYSLLNNLNDHNFYDFPLLEKIIEVLEKRGVSSIAYLPSVLENDYRNKEFWGQIFNDMIEVYENALRKKENITFKDYGTVLDFIIDDNNLQSIIRKIDVLFETIANLEYNLNINMMLDEFIISFSGGE